MIESIMRYVALEGNSKIYENAHNKQLRVSWFGGPIRRLNRIYI
jgi:hypothetical protein